MSVLDLFNKVETVSNFNDHEIVNCAVENSGVSRNCVVKNSCTSYGVKRILDRQNNEVN